MGWNRGRLSKRRGLGSSLGRAAERPTPRTALPKKTHGFAAPLVDEAALAEVIINALRDLEDQLDIDSVMTDLLLGNYSVLFDLVDWNRWERDTVEAVLPRVKLAMEREGAKALTEVRVGGQASHAAAVRAGAAGRGYPPNIPPADPGTPAAPSPRSGGFYGSGRFDMTNPFAVARAEAEAGRLVREITENTRGAIKDVVAQSFRDGVTAVELGRMLRNTIGLTTRQAAAVENYRTRLLGGGLDEARADVLTRRYWRKTRNRRAETIARTEIMRASNMGRMDGWMSAADNGLLDPNTSSKEWVTAPERSSYGPPCPSCLPMDGIKVTGVESEFTLPTGRTLAMPPAHPNCRCTAVVWPPEIPDDFEAGDVFYTGPVTKHGGGSHDETSHGNWARGGAVDRVIERLGEPRPGTYNVDMVEAWRSRSPEENLAVAMKMWRGSFATSASMRAIASGDTPAPAYERDYGVHLAAEVLADAARSAPVRTMYRWDWEEGLTARSLLAVATERSGAEEFRFTKPGKVYEITAPTIMFDDGREGIAWMPDAKEPRP